jgi:alanyl-tRNA synthetase
MEAQRERARAASAFETLKVQDFVYARLSDAPEVGLLELGDRFEGYAVTRVADVAIAALFDAERVQVDHLAEGQTGYVVLPHTPFYIESGGQVSDTGTISSEVTGASALVVAMTRLAHGGPRAHKVTLTRGELRQGERVTALVDEARRDATRRNHTATHLLHAALRRVLGPHVKQAGSLVAPDRLRFDFVHFSPISRDEIARIEDLVNAEVHRNTPVVTEVKATEQAIADGATALFGEKYGEHVRVVSVPGVSMELCGGTHCRATGDIGLFTVVAEGGVAAGVRRIEAFTGAGAVAHVRERSAVLDDVLSVLNVPAPQAASSVERLQHELKRLSREVSELKVRAAMGGGRQQDDVVEIAEGVKFVARRVPGMDKAALRTLSDQLRDQIKQGVVVLASEHDDKVSIVVAVTRDLTGRVKAGQVVKEVAPIVGGSGGGRPDFAEAGGRDASGIDALLAKSRVVVERLAGGAA